MDTDLNGKRAIVCGSTQGIGKSIAIELASLGADITLLARNQSRLQDVLEILDTSRGQLHEYLVADFSKWEQVRDVINEYALKTPKIHILINNTGGPTPGDAIDTDPMVFVRAFEQHLLCNQALVKAVTPAMIKSGFGRIINIISTSVKVPISGLGVSNTIRGAVASWAKTLSNELGPHGITVNNILPGFTKTGRLDGLIAIKANNLGISSVEVEQKMKAGIPLRRFADPAEIAALVGFLASPSGAYITGTSIRVDGGSTPSI